ncbi:MAG: hypothetical protein LH618_05610 [Saprospiraceae bacterium]|nr:hypothetical protein [Saprospiraceae bacterium]
MDTRILPLLAFLLASLRLAAQDTPPIPAAYANLRYDSVGTLLGKGTDGKEFVLRRKTARYTLAGVTPPVSGEKNGLRRNWLPPECRRRANDL